jgi:hypothetical protein
MGAGGAHPPRDYRAGLIVLHPRCPEWGPGKIVHVIGTKVHVIFRGVEGREAKHIDTTKAPLALAANQSDPILDNLPPLQQCGDKWVLPAQRVTFQQARVLFLNRYPQGFEDPAYLGDRHTGERNYKVWAHEHYVQELGGGEAERLLSGHQVAELARRALSVTGRTNLLAVFESAAFSDALDASEAAERFFRALVAVLVDERVRPETFVAYLDAVAALPAKKSKVNTWPVATILPYLAQPTRHMFLKPEATKAAAELLAFDLRYAASPNWKTYEALLRMGSVYFQLLEPLGARDLIDVQSFIWVTCGSPELK